jgi:hypothetical protein
MSITELSVLGTPGMSHAFAIEEPIVGFSVSMWVKYTQSGTLKFFFDQETTRFTLAALSTTSNKIGFFWDSTWYEFGDAPRDGNWNHLLWVFSQTSARLFRNGFRYGDAVEPPTMPFFSQAGAQAFGARYDGGANYFAGILSEVRIYNAALTGQNARYLEQGGKGGDNPEAYLVKEASWPLVGNDIHDTDESAGLYHPRGAGLWQQSTLSKMPTYDEDIYGGEPALLFDGVNDELSGTQHDFNGPISLTAIIWRTDQDNDDRIWGHGTTDGLTILDKDTAAWTIAGVAKNFTITDGFVQDTKLTIVFERDHDGICTLTVNDVTSADTYTITTTISISRFGSRNGSSEWFKGYILEIEGAAPPVV